MVFIPDKPIEATPSFIPDAPVTATPSFIPDEPVRPSPLARAKEIGKKVITAGAPFYDPETRRLMPRIFGRMLPPMPAGRDWIALGQALKATPKITEQVEHETGMEEVERLTGRKMKPRQVVREPMGYKLTRASLQRRLKEDISPRVRRAMEKQLRGVEETIYRSEEQQREIETLTPEERTAYESGTELGTQRSRNADIIKVAIMATYLGHSAVNIMRGMPAQIRTNKATESLLKKIEILKMRRAYPSHGELVNSIKGAYKEAGFTSKQIALRSKEISRMVDQIHKAGQQAKTLQKGIPPAARPFAPRFKLLKTYGVYELPPEATVKSLEGQLGRGLASFETRALERYLGNIKVGGMSFRSLVSPTQIERVIAGKPVALPTAVSPDYLSQYTSDITRATKQIADIMKTGKGISEAIRMASEMAKIEAVTPMIPAVPEMVRPVPKEVKVEAEPEITPPIQKIVTQIGKELATRLTPTQVAKIVQEVTGRERPALITRREDVLLRERLRAEARGAKAGYRLGRKERVVSRRKSTLIKVIKRRLKIGKGLKWGYQERISDLREGLIIKRMTKAERQSLDGLAKFVGSEIDQGVNFGIPKEKIADLGKKYLHEMDEKELTELNDLIQRVIHQGRWRNKAIKIRRGKEINSVASAVGKEIRHGKEPPDIPPIITGEKPPANIFRKMADIGPELIRSERIIEQMGRGRDSATYEYLFEKLNDDYSFYIVNREKAFKKGREYFSRTHKGENLSNEMIPEKIREGLALNHAQMKMVYLWSLDKQARQHLIQGNMFSTEDLKAIQGRLTPQDKKDIEYALKIGREQYDLVSPVYRQLYGVDMPKRALYFHLFAESVDDMGADGISTMLENPRYFTQALEKGFIKPRKGGLSPLMLDFWGNLRRQVDMFEKYKAMALVERDMRKILRHPDVKSAITQTYRNGQKWYKDLNEWFGDVVGYPPRIRQDAISSTFRMLRGRAITSVLWGNVMVMARMTTSLPAGIRRISSQGILQYGSEYIAHPQETEKVIFEKSPIQAERHAGGERDIAEAIEGARARYGTKAIAGKKTLLEKGGKLMFFSDRKTSQLVWWINYRNYLTTHRKTIPDPAKLEARAIREADYMVRTTQPAWRIIDLPKLFRSKREITKMMTMLQNFPNQIINMIVKDDFIAYKDGRISRTRLLSALWWLLIVTPLLYGLSRRWRWPTLREVISDIVLGPIGYIPGIGRTLQSAIEAKITGKRYFSGGYVPLPFMFMGALQKVITTKKFTSKLRWSAQLAALLTGMPFAQPYRTGKGIVDWLRGDTRDLRRFIVSEWSLERPKPTTKEIWR